MYHIYLGKLKSAGTFTKKEAVKKYVYLTKTYGKIVKVVKAK